jgi:hypothetical protein
MICAGFLKKSLSFLALSFVMIIAFSSFALASPSDPADSNSTAPACEENWTCSEWGNCSSGVCSRTCTDENNCGTELDKPPENQGYATATGIVTLTILQPPEICGDGRCTENETCMSCLADCGICMPSQVLAGFMAGSPGTKASGLVAAFAFISLLLLVCFRPVLKRRNR